MWPLVFYLHTLTFYITFSPFGVSLLHVVLSLSLSLSLSVISLVPFLDSEMMQTCDANKERRSSFIGIIKREMDKRKCFSESETK